MAAPLLVHRARVAASAATRADVERWLGRVPIESLGLAADELFYVPRLRMRLSRHEGGADARMPDRILAALRHLLASAHSGWGERFSPGRPYRFTSRGRYFAWLVALWIKEGSAPAREAFAAATGHASLQLWQRAAVLNDGPALVATLARLSEIGCAARWIARFEPADFALAHRALDRGFATRLAAAATPVATGAAPARPVAAAAAPALQQSLPETVAALAARGDDWHSLALPGRTLLLAAAILARAPCRPPRQAALLAEAVAAFCAQADALPAPPAPARASSPAAARPARQRSARVRNATGHAFRQPGGGTAIPRRTPLPLALLEGVEAQQVAPARAETIAAIAPPAVRAGAALAPPPPLVPLSPPPPRPDMNFATGYGGLLFLVNAFVALGLYPDFTQPRGARLDPSPLWLADRIGRLWFGTRYRDDPLAAWIALHASGGRLPSDWRVERAWLAGFGARPAPRLARRRGRATLWDAAGFPIADRAEHRLRPALRALALPRPPFRLPARAPDRWAACLALYLDARLRRFASTGLALLALPARIEIRDLDIRATFALDTYPIQLRIAGLDRDPGWQPAEGRRIAFVFE